MTINIKDLEVLVDSREPQDTLILVKQLFPKARFKQLEVADIVYGSVGIELKTWEDFISSITDARFKNQLFNFFLNPDIRGYYLIYGGWKDINKHSQIKMQAVLGAIASITARYNAQLLMLPNKEYAIYIACKIIEKSFDHKEIKPITYKATTEDKAVNMLLASAERIQEKGVRNALETFGTVKNVINSTQKELEGVKYIGKETVKRFFETINHDFSQKEAVDIEKLNDLIDINKNKVSEDVQAEEDIDYDKHKIGLFTLIETYSIKNNKPCPYIKIRELLPKLQEADLRTMINDLILESRIYESDIGVYDVF